MQISTALVMLMVPGLALFYGGMVRKKNVLATMMHSMAALGIIGVEWVVIGYAMAFGQDQHGLIGWDWKLVFLQGVLPNHVHAGSHTPELVFVMFQGMFAIITPALISGAFAERIKFSAFAVFTLLWGRLIYNPLAHWVWGGGWQQRRRQPTRRQPACRRHRLCGRHGGAYFGGLFGAGGGPLHRQAHWLSAECAAPQLAGADLAGRGVALVRLVWLQRRQCRGN